MEYELSSSEREELKNLLLVLEQQLLQSVEASHDATKPVELSESIGRLTRMDAIQQQQMAKASRASNELRLQQVQEALRAMRNGEYGECKRCGEYIAFKRLQAKPEAPFCLECQSQIER